MRILLLLAAVGFARSAFATQPQVHSPQRRLFDVRGAHSDSALAVSYLWARTTYRAPYHAGAEFRFGNRLTWYRGAAYITSSEGMALRFLDATSVSLSLLQNGGHAGLHAGPVDLGAGFAVSLLNFDYLKHDLSFGMASPRALAFAGVRLGSFRIGLEAHSEYYWRWFGRDYFFRGIGLSLEYRNRQFEHPMFERQR